MQFIGGIIVVLVGIMFLLFPPKKINPKFGSWMTRIAV